MVAHRPAFSSPMPLDVKGPTTTMIVTHEVGQSIAVCRRPDSAPCWTLNYRDKPKPYLHPVRTPAGHCLSVVEPVDHLWHRGLWFTFKFVNGDNFWEEREPYGTQQIAVIPKVRHESPDQADIQTVLNWVAPSGETIITEARLLSFSDGDDAWSLDWETALTAQHDITLDRTPYTTWGGYGGLSFRGSRSWLVERYLFPGSAAPERPAGQTGPWCDLSGPIDGGKGFAGGLAMLDHPDNPRYPTPWYAGGGSMTFINAALLFHEPLNLASGETLRLRYRVLVHDGIWERDRLTHEHERFAATPSRLAEEVGTPHD